MDPDIKITRIFKIALYVSVDIWAETMENNVENTVWSNTLENSLDTDSLPKIQYTIDFFLFVFSKNVGLENTSVGQSGAGIEFGLGDIILVSLVHVTA